MKSNEKRCVTCRVPVSRDEYTVVSRQMNRWLRDREHGERFGDEFAHLTGGDENFFGATRRPVVCASCAQQAWDVASYSPGGIGFLPNPKPGCICKGPGDGECRACGVTGGPCICEACEGLHPCGHKAHEDDPIGECPTCERLGLLEERLETVPTSAEIDKMGPAAYIRWQIEYSKRNDPDTEYYRAYRSKLLHRLARTPEKGPTRGNPGEKRMRLCPNCGVVAEVSASGVVFKPHRTPYGAKCDGRESNIGAHLRPNPGPNKNRRRVASFARARAAGATIDDLRTARRLENLHPFICGHCGDEGCRVCADPRSLAGRGYDRGPGVCWQCGSKAGVKHTGGNVHACSKCLRGNPRDEEVLRLVSSKGTVELVARRHPSGGYIWRGTGIGGHGDLEHLLRTAAVVRADRPSVKASGELARDFWKAVATRSTWPWNAHAPFDARDIVSNPPLILVHAMNPPAPAAVEEAWKRFHQRDRFDGTTRDLGNIKGAPDFTFALGRCKDIDLGNGPRSFSPQPWLVCNPSDMSLWIVSQTQMNLGNGVAGKSVRAITYDPMKSSGKDPAFYRHKFDSPLPVMTPIGSPLQCRAVLLDGGRYKVTEWIHN